MASEEEIYQPKDAISRSVQSALALGGAGLLISAMRNTLTRQNVGAWGVITRSGGIIGTFAAVGGTFEFIRVASANLREKDDSWNPAIAGFFAGGILGLRHRTFPAVLGFGAGLALLQGALEHTGGAFSGYTKESRVDAFERKEQLRKNRRRPIQETLDEVGEGRGIYGPGYQERRRERIKQTYGIDVPPSS